jgi:leucyl aminopeptidase
MRFTVKDKDAIADSKVLVVPVYQDKIKEALQYFVKYGHRRIAPLENLIAAHHFKGEEGANLYLSTIKHPAENILLYGLGDVKKIHLGKIRNAVAICGKILSKLKFKDAAIVIDILFEAKLLPADITAAIAEGAMLGQYEFNKYKKEAKPQDVLAHLTLIGNSMLSQHDMRKCVEAGKIVGEAINNIRDLGMEPANHLTPRIFAERMHDVAKEADIACDIFSKGKIESLKMGALLAVAQGSSEEPRFVVLKSHNKAFTKHVCLVGKGVTFDSGGLSLKPAGGMMEMKYDMVGGATAAYLTVAAKALNIPVNITTLIPLTENLPDGSAIKPGDVIKTMSGLTVEILNTDAEGRLILADALCYAKTLKPDYCIDFATLTGAMKIIAGPKAVGLMGTDQGLNDALVIEGERMYDRCLPLPLWDEYDDDIKSDVADMKNIGKDGEAGTIIGGKFLSKFIEGISWAHLDIASAAWSQQESGCNIKGPTGAGFRCVLAWLAALK